MKTTAPVLQSDFQRDKAKRDKAIFDEYMLLSSKEGASRTAVNNYIMTKFNIHSHTTIYKIIRAQKRLQK